MTETLACAILSIVILQLKYLAYSAALSYATDLSLFEKVKSLELNSFLSVTFMG